MNSSKVTTVALLAAIIWLGSWVIPANMDTAIGLLTVYALGMITVTTGGVLLDLAVNRGQRQLTQSRQTGLKQICKKHNDVTWMLYDAFKNEKRGKTKTEISRLRKEYESQYFQNKKAFEREREQYFLNWEKNNDSHSRISTIWKWYVGIGIFIAILACNYTISAAISEDEKSTPAPTLQSQEGEPTLWNAENIPIPYLQDSTRYVSNPDGVLSLDAQQHVDGYLKKIENEFDIQTVAIVVRRVENADVFRMAQDVGNRYGVGRNDRGLMIVVAYDDHKINISPGRSLEGDLTDAECYRLQQDYVVPCMKAEMPDSAMIYLADALYSTLQHKEMPEIYSLRSNDSGDIALGIIAAYLLLFVGWALLYVYLGRRYGWASGKGNFAPNPFMVQPHYTTTYISFGGGGGGHSSSWGGGSFGGGFGGGSFGGGSFGGGGATSSW